MSRPMLDEPDDMTAKDLPLRKPNRRPAAIEPDDTPIRIRPRDMPSGKFADKQKGINMGEIGPKWGK